MIIDDTYKVVDLQRELAKTISTYLPEYVLKGSMALVLCYGAPVCGCGLEYEVPIGVQSSKMSAVLWEFCSKRNYTIDIIEVTPTQKLYIIETEATTPLQVQVSTYGRQLPEWCNVHKKDGIYTFDPEFLLIDALRYYSLRDSIFDLYNVTHLILKHWEIITPSVRYAAMDVVAKKGKAQLGCTLSALPYPVAIDIRELRRDFVQMCEVLGVNK